MSQSVVQVKICLDLIQSKYDVILKHSSEPKLDPYGFPSLKEVASEEILLHTKLKKFRRFTQHNSHISYFQLLKVRLLGGRPSPNLNSLVKGIVFV